MPFEVIVVDDGSPELARRRWSPSSPIASRSTLVAQPQGGPGARATPASPSLADATSRFWTTIAGPRPDWLSVLRARARSRSGTTRSAAAWKTP